MRIAITGATGLIGRRVVAALRERGDDVTVLSRDPGRAREQLDKSTQSAGTNDKTTGEPRDTESTNDKTTGKPPDTESTNDKTTGKPRGAKGTNGATTGALDAQSWDPT